MAPLPLAQNLRIEGGDFGLQLAQGRKQGLVGILGAVVGRAHKRRPRAIAELIASHHRRQLRLEAIEGRALLLADAIRAGERWETHQDVGHRP